MKQVMKKICARLTAAALAFGMAVSGAAGVANVQAADNKAVSAPFTLTGATFDTENWWDLGTRFFFDCGELAGPITYSFSAYVPKAALSKARSQVRIQMWSNLNGGEKYLGNVDCRYFVILVNDEEQGKVIPILFDPQEEKELLTKSEYGSFLTFGEAGDFYKVDLKVPAMDVVFLEGDSENKAPFEEVQGQVDNFGLNVKINGLFNEKISSLCYIDNISVKTGGKEVLSEADLLGGYNGDGRYYDYVIDEKDASVVERPAFVKLDTNLLKLAKSSASIKAGKKATIKATVAGNAKVTYKSSNKKVATVTAKGVVKGVKAGKAKITVSANGISKTFQVTVKKK